jgi:PAS domain S-box-containing protein
MARRRIWRSKIVRYSLAASAVIVAVLIRMLLRPLTGNAAPSPLFLAVVVATLFGGAGPGIFAALLGALSILAVIAPTIGRPPSEILVGVSLFLIDSCAVVYLGSLIVRGRQRAETAAASNAQNEERLRLAAEAAQVGSYEADLRCLRTSGSPELYRLLGVSPETSIEAILACVHPDDRVAVENAHRGSLDPTGDGKIRIDARVIQPSGQHVWLSWAGRTHFQDGAAVRQLGVIVDISDRKRAEAELLSASQRKDEFLAVLSHELRNPLAAIRSAVSVVELSPSSETASRAHRVIDRQVTQLTRLVDDLLDVTRISRGKLTLQRAGIELGELVQRVGDDHREFAQARGVMLELHPAAEPLWLDADAARLTQAIGNLLHNAAKFTPRGGRITVSIAREQDRAMLNVRDNGAGMPADELPRLFRPFVQLQSTDDRANDGLGLGLALVKGIVELHGGSVTAASEGTGRGSEFTIVLPLSQVPTHAPEAHAPYGGHHRVLVIDDNQDVADSLADVVRMLGHEVRVASDGESGIATVSEFHPDVVLCDLGLPGIDGYEVARRLRTGATSSAVLLVALSGYGQPDDRKRSSAAGFAKHMVKPVTLEALQRTLA